MQMGLPRIIKQLEIVGQDVAKTNEYTARFEELIAHLPNEAQAFARTARIDFVADGDVQSLNQRQREAVQIHRSTGTVL
jgi:hypothetical protein